MWRLLQLNLCIVVLTVPGVTRCEFPAPPPLQQPGHPPGGAPPGLSHPQHDAGSHAHPANGPPPSGDPNLPQGGPHPPGRPSLPEDVSGFFISLQPSNFLLELMDVGLDSATTGEFQQRMKDDFIPEITNVTLSKNKPLWYFGSNSNASEQRKEVDVTLAVHQKWFDFVLSITKANPEATAKARKAIAQYKRMFQEGVCQPNRQRVIRSLIGTYFNTHPDLQRRRFGQHIFGSAISHGLHLVSLDTQIPFSAMTTEERVAANSKMGYKNAFDRFREHNVQIILNLENRKAMRTALQDLENEFNSVHLL